MYGLGNCVSLQGSIGRPIRPYRSSDHKLPCVHPGRIASAGTCGSGRRAVYRRSWSGARISEPAGTDGRAFSAQSVRTGRRDTDVPHRGSGPVASGWGHRILRAERFSSEDSGIPDRTGGDRSAAGGAYGGEGSGSDCARRQRWREASGGLLHLPLWERAGRRRSRRGGTTKPSVSELTGVHGASGVRAAGVAAADGEWEAGSQSVTTADWGCIRGTWVRRARGRDGNGAGGNLG